MTRAILTGGRPALSAMLAALAVSGCAVGPNFHAPGAPDGTYLAPQGDTPPPSDQRLVEGMAVPARWWSLFQSPDLDRIVQQALRSNPDLEAARRNLAAARASYLATRGQLLPSIDLGASAQRARNPDSLANPLSTNATYYALYSGQASISYVLDVFGGVRRQVEGAKAQAEQQRYEAAAAYATLTANVVGTVIQLASLNDQIDAAGRSVAAANELLRITRRQAETGGASEVDVAAQESALAQAQLQLSPLRKQRAQAQDLLAALTGVSPSNAPRVDFGLAALRLPPELPVSLPATLVRQRPDVLAAEANLHAASAAVGVAVAARLPSLTLSGVTGGASSRAGHVFDYPDTFFTVTGQVAQPVFQGGALYYRQRGAEAAYKQAAAQYRSAVLAGLPNVADALHAVTEDADAFRASTVAEAAAVRSLKLARRQLELGQGGVVQALQAEQAYQTAETTAAQARAQRMTDAVALFQALGGAWWDKESGAGLGPVGNGRDAVP